MGMICSCTLSAQETPPAADNPSREFYLEFMSEDALVLHEQAYAAHYQWTMSFAEYQYERYRFRRGWSIAWLAAGIGMAAGGGAGLIYYSVIYHRVSECPECYSYGWRQLISAVCIVAMSILVAASPLMIIPAVRNLKRAHAVVKRLEPFVVEGPNLPAGEQAQSPGAPRGAGMRFSVRF